VLCSRLHLDHTGRSGEQTETSCGCADLEEGASDPHMELIRVLESKGTHRNDVATPLGTIVGSDKQLDLLFVDHFRVLDGTIIDCDAVRDRLDMILKLERIPLGGTAG
jgi:hypothetical protein